VIFGYDQSGFDEMALPTGPVGYDGPTTAIDVEGPRTRVIYAVPGDRSPLEVVRNYRAELTAQGFDTAYECGKADCGPTGAMVQHFYPLSGRLKTIPRLTERAFSLPRDDHRYLLARHPQTGRTVSVYAAFETFDHDPRTRDKTLVLVDVFEGAAMTQRMELVSAEQMTAGLTADGRVSLYGIRFAHDSDVLTPESDPTLAEIARALAASASMQLFVVGHTDMTGDHDYNLDLSRRRAASVVAALTGRFGVQGARLQAAGVGPLAPVADNASDAGRALNRRVELVRR
jgi:outer membrane protein OmpA-like peptidoglycan-associated protein